MAASPGGQGGDWKPPPSASSAQQQQQQRSPASPPAGQGEQLGPRVPLDYCDAPTQRFYAVSAASSEYQSSVTHRLTRCWNDVVTSQASLFALLQSYKLFHFVESYLATSSSSPSPSRTWLLLKYSLYDALFLLLLLPWLRIPRLTLPLRVNVLLLGVLLTINWILVGDWRATSLLGGLGLLLPSSFRGE